MNKNILSNFALLRTLSDDKKDLLDSMAPFVEFAIQRQSSDFVDLDTIKQYISSECSIDIPNKTLITILKRMKKQGEVDGYNNWQKIEKKENFKKYSNEYLNGLKGSIRDVNELIRNYKEMSSSGKSEEEILNEFYFFIETYHYNMDLEKVSFNNVDVGDKTEHKKILEFLLYIEYSNNRLYSIFRDVFYGFMLSSFISQGESVIEKKIKNMSVFVDSNFLLRVLDFQSEYHTLASTEMLKLMCDHGMKIIALPEVVSEIRAVINKNGAKYIKEQKLLLAIHNGSLKELDGIMGAFARRDMGSTDIMDAVDSLEISIENLGISVSANPIGDTIKYNEDEYNQIVEIRNKKSFLSENYTDYKSDALKQTIKYNALLDSKLLAYIRYLRKTKKFQMEKCEYILLTCDNVLYNVNKNNHSVELSIPEAISETEFTNILFMNNPSFNSNAPVKLLISIFKSSTQFDFNNLVKFHENLKTYIDKNPDEERYLGLIFRNQQLLEDAKDYLVDDGDTDEKYFKKVFEEARRVETDYHKIEEREKRVIKEIKELRASFDIKNDEIEKLKCLSDEKEKESQKELSLLKDMNAKIWKFFVRSVCVVFSGLSILNLLNINLILQGEYNLEFLFALALKIIPFIVIYIIHRELCKKEFVDELIEKNFDSKFVVKTLWVNLTKNLILVLPYMIDLIGAFNVN